MRANEIPRDDRMVLMKVNGDVQDEIARSRSPTRPGSSTKRTDCAKSRRRQAARSSSGGALGLMSKPMTTMSDDAVLILSQAEQMVLTLIATSDGGIVLTDLPQRLGQTLSIEDIATILVTLQNRKLVAFQTDFLRRQVAFSTVRAARLVIGHQIFARRDS